MDARIWLHRHIGMRPAILWGALSAMLLTFPLAAVCAIVYRFPVPFGGYVSGIAPLPYVLMGVFFYGILGGFPLLAVSGALAGWVAHQAAQPNSLAARRLAAVFGALVAVLGVVLLAVLDKLIGPW
jgi:hypothetical protein